jgi:hypothetical protein
MRITRPRPGPLRQLVDLVATALLLIDLAIHQEESVDVGPALSRPGRLLVARADGSQHLEVAARQVGLLSERPK